MPRLCYVFSRYSREPYDGKQSQLFKVLPLLARRFERIDLLGLARSKEDLRGTKWAGLAKLEITELVFPGSYDVQSLVCLWAKYGWIPWPGLQAMRRWLKERDHEDTVFFFEGFPLAGLLRWPRKGQVFWGEVDSYLLRAHRMRRMGVRRGLNSWLGMVVAKHLERMGLATAAATHVYSESDARFLRRIHENGKVVGIPMSCNLPVKTLKAAIVRKTPRVLVWADSSYPYLEVSMKNVFQAIGSAKGDRKADFVFLIGNNQALKAKISEAGWEVHTRVDDLDDLVANMDFVLLPDLSGTGLKNRTLNALTRGLCVIGTKTAWEGIPITDGVHGVVVRSSSGIPDLIADLFVSKRNLTIALAGQELILGIFSREAIGSKWEQFFDNRNLTHSKSDRVMAIALAAEQTKSTSA
jgi:hypothetical protein